MGWVLIVFVDSVADINAWGVESGIELNPKTCWVDDAEFIVLVFVVDVEPLVILPEFVFEVE